MQGRLSGKLPLQLKEEEEDNHSMPLLAVKSLKESPMLLPKHLKFFERVFLNHKLVPGSGFSIRSRFIRFRSGSSGSSGCIGLKSGPGFHRDKVPGSIIITDSKIYQVKTIPDSLENLGFANL